MKAISGLPNTTMSIEILISNGKLALNISYKKTSKDSADSEDADSGNADSENASEASDKEVSYSFTIRVVQIFYTVEFSAVDLLNFKKQKSPENIHSPADNTLLKDDRKVC